MTSVYVARTLTPAAMRRLADSEWSVSRGNEAPPARADLLKNVSGKDAAIVTLTEKVDAEFFDAAGSQLQVVANVAVGFDNIDIDEAARRGVVITNTPGVLDGATADHTMALLLATTRRVVEADRFIRSGTEWVWGPTMFTGLDISAGITLGIIGLGRIGKAVATRARAFDMRVIAYDAGRQPGDVVAGVEIVSFEQLLAQSQVVSLHCPLLPSTRHLIDAAALAAMKPGSYLINAARGPIVDEEALADSLDSGHLAGAGLDTFENEPLVNPRLVASEKTVLTPHTASAGLATRENMCSLAIDNVIAVLSGREPLTPVKPRVARA
jgi:lactate dehydrogenase-like 2-hydroxyacid dehydrogenase